MSEGFRYNKFTIVTGQDFRRVLVMRDPTAEKIDNPDYDPTCPESADNPKKIYPPKNLTGYIAEMDIRIGPSREDTALVELSDGAGITIGSPDPVDGTVEIFIDNTVTASAEFLNFAGSKAYYDLFLIAPAPGDAKRILFGTIPVEGTVTDV